MPWGNWARNERLRFLVVGAVNTGFGYGSFAVLFLLIGQSVHYLVVSALAYAVSVLVAFQLQRHFVFRSRAPWWPQFMRYNLTQWGMLLGSMASLSALVSGLGWHPLAAQALVTAGAVVVAYLSHRHFSFRHR
jgi:putative flippase GtrA